MTFKMVMESDILENAKTENLVTFVEGEIPVLLTVPHGGTDKPADIDIPRSESRGYKTRDTETFQDSNEPMLIELVFRIADRLTLLVGERPYIVAARFSRKYVDANRNDRLLGLAGLPYENHAYDQPAGKKYYEQYHTKISQYVTAIGKSFKNQGLLFDFHGSLFQDNKIVVGMVTYDPLDFQRYFHRGHVSVDKLIATYGFDPIYHPSSGFIALLSDKHLPGGNQTQVVPGDRFERASPSGGFTVTSYGSNRPGGVNAFQLECSYKLLSQWFDYTVGIYTDAIHSLYRNVVDSPYRVETVFSGKRHIDTGKKLLTDTGGFFFALNHTPRKGFPLVVLMHTQRVRTRDNRVMLNDSFLGFLKPDSPVSIFEIDLNGGGKLRKKNNHLSIVRVDPAEPDDFDITKVDVIYCYP